MNEQVGNENKFVFVKLDERASERIAAPKYSYWGAVFKKFFSSKVTVTMLVVAVLVLLISLIQPLFSGYKAGFMPYINIPSMKFLKPSIQFPFGTDNVGNSLFDAVWAGAKNSLSIALITTAITNVLGIVFGAFWGYSKKLDKFFIEIYNVVANIPFTLLVIVLMYILGAGFWQLIFAMSVTSWLGVAYFVRIQVMIIRDRDYNLASRCLGTPTSRMISKNILPHLISVIVTSIARDVPMYISYEVFLSYLGIGLGSNTASLGRIIAQYTNYMNGYPYLFWIPVAISAIISVSLYVVGQSLADASDPRTHM